MVSHPPTNKSWLKDTSFWTQPPKVPIHWVFPGSPALGKSWMEHRRFLGSPDWVQLSLRARFRRASRHQPLDRRRPGTPRAAPATLAGERARQAGWIAAFSVD